MGAGRHSKQADHRTRWTVAATVVTVAALAAAGVALIAIDRPPTGEAATRAARLVPYQFMAKAYTELLGRAPTPAEWAAGTAYFEAHACTPATLERYGAAVVGSGEYRADYPAGHQAATALTLYRFVLDREPDAAEFVALRDRLGGETALAGAEGLFASAEFRTTTAPAICSPARAGYGFGEPGSPTGRPAIQIPSTGAPGPDRSGGALQAALDALSARGGGTFALPDRQVVGLVTTLTVPGNVTLTTAGGPTTHRYAEMARLVRLPAFAERPGYAGAELVSLAPGARLVHVWVDGQRYAPDNHVFLDFDVRMLGGVGTTVQGDRIGNPSGATNLEDDAGTPGPGDPRGCARNVVADNLVEGYATAHTPPGGAVGDHTQADGLGILCGDTRVLGNDIVDVSDAAIVLFNGGAFDTGVPPQQSLVAGNTVVSAGNSLYFGIVTDPFYSLAAGGAPGGDPAGTTTRAFGGPGGGAVIRDNRIWTGARTHIDVVLSSGSHDLFGSTVHQDCLLPTQGGVAACGGGRNATGATWIDNTSAGLPSRAEMGIYVGGTDGAVFRGNHFPDLGHVTGGGCPRGAVVVATGRGPSTDFARGLRIDQTVTHDTALASDKCVVPSY